MLEALMNRTTDAKRAAAADERQELERLIQTARAERAALDETLLVLKARGANLKPIGTFLEHIDDKVTGVHEENVTGLTCFGFSLRYAQPATDAISCSLPHDRIKPGREEEIIAAMEATRLAIERMAPASITPERAER